MSECTHDCSSCGLNCPSRESQSLLEKPHEGTRIKKVIAVMSGKGGVGKSLVTALLAVMAQRAGYKTDIDNRARFEDRYAVYSVCPRKNRGYCIDGRTRQSRKTQTDN